MVPPRVRVWIVKWGSYLEEYGLGWMKMRSGLRRVEIWKHSNVYVISGSIANPHIGLWFESFIPMNDPIAGHTVQITIWPKSTSVSAASSVLPPVLHFEDVLPTKRQG